MPVSMCPALGPLRNSVGSAVCDALRTVPDAYHDTAGGLSQIAKNEGIKGLYQGLTPTLMALLPNWAVSGLQARCQHS